MAAPLLLHGIASRRAWRLKAAADVVYLSKAQNTPAFKALAIPKLKERGGGDLECLPAGVSIYVDVYALWDFFAFVHLPLHPSFDVESAWLRSGPA